MRYDRILRRVWVKIGGDEYALSFNLSTIGKLDALTNGHLLVRFQTGDIPINVMIEGFKEGLRVTNKEISLGQAKSLCEKFTLENGLQELSFVFLATFAVSGLLGAKWTSMLLKRLGMENLDEEPKEEEEGKNEKMPKE